MKTPLFAFFSLYCLSTLSTPILADETIVVQGTKIPIPLEKTTNSQMVFTKDEIEKSSATTLPQFLQQQSGFTVSDQSIFIRGQNSQNYLLIIDDIRYNDPSQIGRNASLDGIDFSQIERIEILKGTQSVLYGSDAVAGVIKITTKKKEKSLSLDASLGDHQLYKTSTNFNLPLLSTLSLDGQASFLKENAISSASVEGGDKDPRKQFTSGLGLTYHFNPDLEFMLHSNYSHINQEIDDGAKQDDPEREMRKITLGHHGQLKAQLFDGKVESILSYDESRFDRLDRDDAYPTHFKGITRHYEWQNNFFLNQENTFALGIEKHDDFDRSNSSTLSNRKQSSESAYLLHQYLGDLFFSNSGLRYDHFKSFGGKFNGKLAPGVSFNQHKTKVFTSVATNFKAPSLYQLYESQWGAGNSGLEPERGYTAELGTEHQFSLLKESSKISATLFYSRLLESIIYGPSYNYENGGEERTRGFEWAQEHRIGAYSLQGNYTYLLALDGNRKPQLRRPKHQVSLSGGYSPIDSIFLQLEYLYKGKREDYKSPTARYILGGHSLFNFSGNYQFAKNWKTTGRLTNLTNKKYEDNYGYQTEGRGFELSLQYQY